MRIVLDNNIIFSLMNPKSIASYIFFFLDAEIFVPEFIQVEFNKYKEVCLLKSGLSEYEFGLRQEEIEEKIKFVKLSAYEDFFKESLNVLADPDDVDFLALALFTNSVIWSNDLHFKQQSLVKVFSTSELIDKLLKAEL